MLRTRWVSSIDVLKTRQILWLLLLGKLLTYHVPCLTMQKRNKMVHLVLSAYQVAHHILLDTTYLNNT